MKAKILLMLVSITSVAAGVVDFSPRRSEQQLPQRMHSKMDELPSVRVGQQSGDFVGRDHRVLQAAVEYVAALGGGTVHIGPGVYEMRDSLHLRSYVAVVGSPGTVLKKGSSVRVPLALDGDFGEEQVTLEDIAGFEVGHGIAVWDDRAGGFHTTVGRITGRRGNTVSISRPLNADCMVHNQASAATVFPVISGYDIEGARVEGITIDGNRSENVHLNGCRGAGIFLYRGFGTVIENCTVRNYHGDGISFQQSNDVVVRECLSEGNSHLGLHPGSGSQRPQVLGCTARENGEDGLFLCWRVRHGLFENNILEGNGRFGISIGHKDSDNLLRGNHVLLNSKSGVFFRNETLGMAGHRNQLVNNLIENNATSGEGAGIRVRGEVGELEFRNNTIRDTREGEQATQAVGIQIEERVGSLRLIDNQVQASETIVDLRSGSN
jgi:polygalacturonase